MVRSGSGQRVFDAGVVLRHRPEALLLPLVERASGRAHGAPEAR